MKDLTNYFRENENIIFKDLNEVLPKDLNSRKKIKIYCGTSIEKEYIAIFIVDLKSRFLRKNGNDLEELFESLKSFKEHNFKRKYLLISSPLCSKAKAMLEDLNWRVKIDFM